jgi:hypothetical protein
MGYEDRAIRYIIRTGKATVDEIEFKNLPTFKYELGNRVRNYFPDLKVRNNIVEVKSTYTLAHHPDLFESVKSKRKAVVASGYKFQLLVMHDDGSRLPLPADWYSLTYEELLSHL